MPKLKLTSELQEKLGNNITLGMPLKFAAEAVGITEQTFYNWMKKGEAETKGQFFEFCEYVKECQAKAVQLHLKLITKAASEGSWQASAWILERRFGNEFGRREKIDMKAEVIDKTEVPLTPEVVEARHMFLKAVANAKSDN